MRGGQLLDERFELLERAASGGMGTVWRGIDRRTGAPVAIKILARAGDEEGRRRFQQEVLVLGEIAHPGIVRAIGSGALDDGAPWLAMEWLEGEDLAVRLQRGPLGVVDGLALLGAVAAALGHAHTRSIVHRDVKPSNLFLPDGRAADARVLDFGVAHVADAPSKMTGTGVVLGTPSYMAPEQVKGEPVDPRSDVFALGAVLYECIAGRQAFGGPSQVAVLARILLDEPASLEQVAPGTPRSVSDLCGRMLSKASGARPADGRVLAAEVAAIAADLGRKEVRTPSASVGALEMRLCSVVLAPGIPDPDQTVRTAVTSAATPSSARRVRMRDGTTAILFEGAQAPELAARAARAALELRARDPRALVAVATGRAATRGRLPAGEAIDRAAELVQGGGGGARIDELTAGLLGDRFDVERDAHGLLLRGVRSNRIEGRTLLGKPAPFFGRAQEKAMFEGLVLGAAEEGTARVVLLSGAPGIGKSRLLEELLRGLHVAHPEVRAWTGRADPTREGSPLALLSQALGGALGLAEADPDARRARLEARVARAVEAAERSRVSEFLGELCAVPFPDQDRPELRAARASPLLMGDQIRRAIEDFVAAECGAAPLLLVLDDLQWGDAATVETIDRMLRNLADHPLVVVAVARPEVTERFPRLWAERGLVTIPVGPLAPKVAERIARAALGDDVPADRIRHLVARADGNAFFLEELVRTAAEGRWDEAPATVLAITQSRLESLEPPARRVLRAASVLGDTFWEGAVAHLLGIQASEAAPWIELLEARELVTLAAGARFSTERELLFRHAVVREAAYAMLTDEDRLVGHGLAADWLEARGERDALVIATHLERARAPQRAAPHWARAAAQALEASDLNSTIERARRAIDAGATGADRGLAWLVAAEARYWRGDNAEAADAAAAAVADLAPGEARFYTAAWLVVVANGRLGRTEIVEGAATRIEHTPPRPGAGTARLVAMALSAARLLMLGRQDRAVALLSHVITQPGADHSLVVAALATARAEQAWQEGDKYTHFLHTTTAVREYMSSGDLRRACLFRGNLGYAYSELGLDDVAIETLRTNITEAVRVGLPQVEAACRSILGSALTRVRRLAEGRAELVRAAENLRTGGDRGLEGGARFYLARNLLLHGELAMAESELHRAIDLLQAAPTVLPHAHATMATILAQRGALMEAEAVAQAAADLAEKHRAIAFPVRLTLAEIQLALGLRDAARATVRAAREDLLASADLILSPEFRASYLAIAEHAKLLALAEELG